MAEFYNAARIACLDGLSDGILDGATNGTFRLFDNSSPPVQLVSFTFNNPAFNAAADDATRIRALLNTATTLVSNTYSGSTATIGEYRIYDGDGNLLITGTVQVSGGDYNVPSLTIENGYTFELQSGRTSMTRSSQG